MRLRPLIPPIAGTVVTVAFELSVGKGWFDSTPDAVVAALWFAPVILWVYWLYTHEETIKRRHLLYARPVMYLILFIIVGGALGAGAGTLGWWSIYRQRSHLSSPDNNVPMNPPKNEKVSDVKTAELTQMDRDTTVLYEDKKVVIYNKGQQNLYLWGSVYGNIAPVVDSKPRVISPGNYYYLFAEGLEKQFIDGLDKNHAADGTLPYFVFITTENGEKYTLNWLLLGKRNPQGGVTIHTQNLGTESGWKSGNDPNSLTTNSRLPTENGNPAPTKPETKPLAVPATSPLTALTDGQRFVLKEKLAEYHGHSISLVLVGHNPQARIVFEQLIDIFQEAQWKVLPDEMGIVGLGGANFPDNPYLTSSNIGAPIVGSVFSVFSSIGIDLPLTPNGFRSAMSEAELAIVVH